MRQTNNSLGDAKCDDFISTRLNRRQRRDTYHQSSAEQEDPLPQVSQNRRPRSPPRYPVYQTPTVVLSCHSSCTI